MATFSAGVDLDLVFTHRNERVEIVAAAGQPFEVPDADGMAIEFEQAMGSTLNTGPWQRHTSIPHDMAAWLRLQRGEPDGDHAGGAACLNPLAPACERHWDIGFVPVPQPTNAGRIPGLTRIS